MRNEWGQSIITGFGHMHFVPYPLGGMFPRIMSIRIIGGADETRRRWNIVILTPAHPLSRGQIILHPNLPQPFDSGYITERGRRTRSIDRTQQCDAVSSNSLRQGLAFGFVFG